MADLMHDFDVVSRIASLIGTARGRYEGLTLDVTSQILADIQVWIHLSNLSVMKSDLSLNSGQVCLNGTNIRVQICKKFTS